MATEPFGGTRRAMNRAIWRLNVLEWVMLFAAAFVAALGGWLVAWLVRGLGLPFGLTWTLASVLLFAVPGMTVLAREARGGAGAPPMGAEDGGGMSDDRGGSDESEHSEP